MTTVGQVSPSAGSTSITQLPLAFVRSGFLEPDYGHIVRLGYGGVDWSQTSLSSNNAYYFYFWTDNMRPSNGNTGTFRIAGFALRYLYMLEHSSEGRGIKQSTSITQLPLAFVRSGVIYLDDGQAFYVGSSGYSRSRASKFSTNAYYLLFDTGVINPSHYSLRWFGLPLRCLCPMPAKTSITQLPLAFVRSGYTGLEYGQALYAGGTGYDWSRASTSSIGVYYLGFNSNNVRSSDISRRWAGFPLRCLFITQLPLAFVRSGCIKLDYNQAHGVGTDGYGWPRTSSSFPYAYYLGFSTNGIGQSNSTSRWYGHSLRCHSSITQLPLAFVRSGYINLSYGQAHVVGSRGYDWSRTSRSSTYAYNLDLNTDAILPSANNGRWLAFPLRCLCEYKQSTSITHLPLAFVRSGFVYLPLGQADVVGERGNTWSRTSKTPTNAYRPIFNTGVYPSDDGNRWNGFSLCCLFILKHSNKNRKGYKQSR